MFILLFHFHIQKPPVPSAEGLCRLHRTTIKSEKRKKSVEIIFSGSRKESVHDVSLECEVGSRLPRAIAHTASRTAGKLPRRGRGSPLLPSAAAPGPLLPRIRYATAFRWALFSSNCIAS
jgi:hypothetical protein